MGKLDIVILKIYIVIRQIINIALWIAMMTTVVPVVTDHNDLWMGQKAAVGFGIFAAVLGRVNRLFLSCKVCKSDGSKEDNKKKQVRSHGGLKFFYFPLALMLAAIAQLKSTKNLYDGQMIAEMGSVTAYIFGSFIILNFVLIVAIILKAVCSGEEQLDDQASAMVVIMLIMWLLMLLFLVVGFCLAIYAAAVISRSGEWRISQTLTFTLVMVEIAEGWIDVIMNCICVE